MSDNIAVRNSTASGAKSIATDDVGGVQHQLIKIEYGVDGAATMVSAASPLPVTDLTAQGYVDGLEALVTTLNGYVDTLEALVTSLSAEVSEPDTAVNGTAATSVSLPSGARLHSVLVVPSAGGQLTVTVPGQSADTLPADLPYSEDFKGGIVGGVSSSVVIAGGVSYYRVTYDA